MKNTVHGAGLKSYSDSMFGSKHVNPFPFWEKQVYSKYTPEGLCWLLKIVSGVNLRWLF